MCHIIEKRHLTGYLQIMLFMINFFISLKLSMHNYVHFMFSLMSKYSVSIYSNEDSFLRQPQ